MDGKALEYGLRNLINEKSTSRFLDARTSYSFLYEAAVELTRISECFRTTQAITTIANQAAYTIDGNFLALYLKNSDNQFFLKYNDGSNDYFLEYKPYQEVIWDNDTDSVTIPSYWTITADPTLDDQIAVDASQAGAAVGGKSNLTVVAETFEDITTGDICHNTDDGSDGVVVAYTSTTSIDVALFGGTDNDVTDEDSFIIQPKGRLLLQLDPPPSTADHTVTLYFIHKPDPVYHSYGVYPFAFDYGDALIKYAGWLYKYRDSEPDFGNAWYTFFLSQAEKHGELFKKAVGRDSSCFRPRLK